MFPDSGNKRNKLKKVYFTTNTIQKVKFLSKNSILTKPQHFHEFFTKMFLTIFLVKSKLSTAKKPKTTTFSRVFSPKKINNFLGKSKLNFWTKNEDFEQCVFKNIFLPHNCIPNIQFSSLVSCHILKYLGYQNRHLISLPP